MAALLLIFAVPTGEQRVQTKTDQAKSLPVRFHHADGVKLTLSIRPASTMPWTAVRRLRLDSAAAGSSLRGHWRLA
jgi:hypothetical protein